MHGVLEFLAQRLPEFGTVEHGLQHVGDHAVAFLEGGGHARHQRLWRIVADEILGQLAADEMRGGGTAAEAIQRFVEFGQPPALHRLPEELLVAVIVAVRVEFEQAPAHVLRLQGRFHFRRVRPQVHAHAGQDARQFLHVRLAVAAVDAQGVQLHQFARIVFIDALDGVGFIVQVAQHGGMVDGRAQQVAKFPQGMRRDGVRLVIADHGAQVVLALVHAEMVEPEPAQLLLQLLSRIHVQQQRTRGRLARQAVEFLLVILLRLLLRHVVHDGGRLLALLLHRHHQLIERYLTDGHGVDLRLHGGRQAGFAWVQLRPQVSAPAVLLQLAHAAAIHAPADPFQHGDALRGIVGRGGGMLRGRRRRRGAAGQQQQAHQGRRQQSVRVHGHPSSGFMHNA